MAQILNAALNEEDAYDIIPCHTEMLSEKKLQSI
jgi:hypothetical protein